MVSQSRAARAADPVTPATARFLGRLIRELAAAFRKRRGRPFRDLPEYGRLIEGAYAMKFVAADIAPRPEYFLPYLSTPERLMTADLRTARRFVHYMMRAERHADAGSELGGGCIFDALRSGALEIVAERLDRWAEGAG
jgi:hypothetical protein